MKAKAKSVYHSWSHSPLSFGNILALPSGTNVEAYRLVKQVCKELID